MSDEANTDSTATPKTRERSTVNFPYSDLESAIKLVEAMHTKAGDECTTDQLAGFIGMTGSSGGFRLRLSTARTFGLIETQRGGKVILTDLGGKMVDANQREEAALDAFLHVPLYSAIYDRYKSKLLPPRKGLERVMESLGVSSKQKDKARQAFERSARQAGFFAQGEDRLVEPIVRRGRWQSDTQPPAELPTDSAPSANSYNQNMHPFIEGLLQSLPAPETEWSTEQQAKWLQTAAGIFGLIYKGSRGEIKVSVARAPSQLPENTE